MSDLDSLVQELPPSWALATLGDLVDYGRTNKAEPGEIDDSAWVLELEDVEKDSSRLLQRITFGERQSKSTKNRFDAGDVLYGKLRPYLNKVLIADQPGFCTTEIVPIKCPAQLDTRFVYYWLKHPAFLRYVEAESHGMNMPRLGTEAGKAAPFVLAPRPEQTRIADQLDTLLARIKACNDHLAAIPGLLERFRQAVLDAAVTGRTFTGSGMWEQVPLGELISRGPSNGLYKPAQFYGRGMRIVRIDMFYSGELTSWDNCRRLEVTEAEHRSFGLEVGDLLINRVNSPTYVGKCALIRTLPEDAVFESNMMRLKVQAERVVPEYLMRFLCSSVGLQRLRAGMKHAVNQSSINQHDVQEVIVELPPVDDQRRIVGIVSELLAGAERLESRWLSAHRSAAKLTGSTLAKAFRGELVPQDPNDEPASALLARIAAQRNALTDTASAAAPRRGRPPRSASQAHPTAKPRP